MRLKALIKTLRLFGGDIVIEWMGGTITPGPRLATQIVLAYSAAPIIDASLGNEFVMTITDNVAFVLGAPINPPPTGYNQKIRLTYRNTAGVAHGAGTLNAVFKGAALTAVATANNRTLEWQWNGVNWVEQWRGAADIPN
jgi:hypothetical protein